MQTIRRECLDYLCAYTTKLNDLLSDLRILPTRSHCVGWLGGEAILTSGETCKILQKVARDERV